MSRADARAALVRLCERGLDWRVEAMEKLSDPLTARRSGVLVLFGSLDSTPSMAEAEAPPVGRDLDILLQRRTARMRHHAGQIAFPGGGFEQGDADLRATALREAVEETGLDPTGVEILGSLPPIPLPVSDNIVTPVPAWWTRESEVAAVDHREAVEVFRMPVADLLDPANRASVVHEAYRERMSTPAFTVGDRLVWGFTAIVLDRMFDALGWTEEWDTERTVMPPELAKRLRDSR